MDTANIAVSGIQAGLVRLANAAHNVANLTTPDFQPLRTHQASIAGGGTRALSQRESRPAELDLAFELVESLRAAHATRASLRVLGIEAELSGSLVDLVA